MCFVEQGQHKLPDANNDFVSLLYMLAYSIINKTCRTCTMLLLCGNERAGNHNINRWSIEQSAALILLYTIQKNERNIYTHTHSHVPYDANRVLRFLMMKSRWHTHTHVFVKTKRMNERTNEEITGHHFDGAKRF